MAESTQDLSDIQKAWRVVRMGKPSKAVEIDTSLPVPKDVKQGEVLVKIHAAALNPVYVSFMA